MRSSSRVADLAAVFPGALYTLATCGRTAERQQALELIEQGAPLKRVAQVLSLPLWLRRLPPEAFAGSIARLPGSEDFARRIANRLPVGTENTALWLESIAFASRACHENFALWLALQPVFAEPGETQRMFRLLAAYAWFSGAGHSRAHDLIVVPWRPEIAFDTALCAAKSWFNRVRLLVLLTPGVISDTWLGAGTINGFTFTPLADAATILEEARVMQNCADQYGDRLVRDRCRLFSIRRGEVRVATMEIGPHPREAGFLAINQLKARHNMPASLEIWQAAFAWMAQQPVLKRAATHGVPDRPIDVAQWHDLFTDYRRLKAGAPWLPETISSATLSIFDAEMTDLARRGGVSSWLFT